MCSDICTDSLPLQLLRPLSSDFRLGQLMRALKESNLTDDSTIIALGDHSALDEASALQLNVLLHKQNLITVNAKGHVTDWKVYCNSCDGSAYIYMKDEHDHETKMKVSQIIEQLLDDPASGIEFIINGEEAEKTRSRWYMSIHARSKERLLFSRRLDWTI